MAESTPRGFSHVVGGLAVPWLQQPLMMNKINYSGYRFPPEIIPGKHTWEIEQVKFLSVEPRGPVWVDAVEKVSVNWLWNWILK